MFETNRIDSWAVRLKKQPLDKHLQDFYQRLLATDAQVRELKRSLVNIPKYTGTAGYQERQKRSAKLKRIGKDKRWKRDRVYEERKEDGKRDAAPNYEKDTIIDEEGNLQRLKVSNKTNPVSIVVEKKQLFVQYKPDDTPRKYEKCTHSAKEQKTHEEILKHPYHKNTERLDRILDQIIGSDVKFGDSEQLFKKKKSKCKHPKINQENSGAHEKTVNRNEQIEDPVKNSDILNGREPSNDGSESPSDEDFASSEYTLDFSNGITMKEVTKSTTEGYRVFLGMTTMMDPIKRENKHRSLMGRKLLAIDEDEDKLDLSYEDLKEVLADKVEDHDEQDRQVDKRAKRQEVDLQFEQPASPNPAYINDAKYNSYIQNWNRPKPFYQDEMNLIMNRNSPKETRYDKRREKPRQYRKNEDKNSFEYIDDVLTKLDKFDKVAQAYSDYGVFDGGYSKDPAADNTHAQATEINYNFGSKSSDKRRVSLISEELGGQPSVGVKRNDRLNRVVLTGGRIKRSATTEHEAIDEIVLIADNIKKKHLEMERATKIPAAKRNVEVVTTNDKITAKGVDNNPIFGLIFGMFSSTTMPTEQGHSNSMSKRSNGTRKFGHLSRTLLSVDDFSENNTMSNVDNNTERITKCLAENCTQQTTGVIDNATVIIIESDSSKDAINGEKKRSVMNATVMKRNVDEGNHLAFWTDMYDDEYGVDTVPFDEVVDEKNNPKRNDIDKKSRSWLGRKMKKISGSFHKRTTGKNLEGIAKDKNEHRVVKREFKDASSDDKDAKVNFGSLHSKMREVCKKAVKEAASSAEKQEEPGQVDGRPGTAAASLMQQLVQLMAELVDYQVQQRTCRRLPPDLQEFLEWLNSPGSGGNKRSLQQRDRQQQLDDVWRSYFPSEGFRASESSKASYEDVAKNIKNLEREYDAMSERDKENLSGVKEHLQYQLMYLQEALSGYKNKRSNPLEYERNTERITNDRKFNEIRNKRTYLRNFGRKHTRSTAAGFIERMSSPKYDGNTDNVAGKVELRRDEVKRQKKNLRDVYYKALSDAMKQTTMKVSN